MTSEYPHSLVLLWRHGVHCLVDLFITEREDLSMIHGGRLCHRTPRPILILAAEGVRLFRAGEESPGESLMGSVGAQEGRHWAEGDSMAPTDTVCWCVSHRTH